MDMFFYLGYIIEMQISDSAAKHSKSRRNGYGKKA